MPTGAAIAASTIGSAAIGASAAKSAAKTQADAANQATALQEKIYNQTTGNLQPFTTYGTGALPALNKLLGLDASGAPVAAPVAPVVGDPNIDAWLKANPDVVTYYNQTPGAQAEGSVQDFAKTIAQQQSDIRGAVPTYTARDVAGWTPPPTAQEQALQQLPGYQFARDQGIQSVNRTLGSTGQTGAQAKGIARFVTGLADQTYNTQVKNLSDAAGLGENAAAGAGNIGATTGANIAGTTVGAGAASAAGTVGAANSINGAIGSGLNAYLTNNILNGTGAAGASGIYGSGSGAAAAASDLSGLY